MKKQAAFLFVPLFFAVGFFHNDKSPHFSFFTPHYSQLASAHFAGAAADSGADTDSNFSWRDYREHRYDGNSTNSRRHGVASEVSQNTLRNTPDASPVDSTPTPEVPNTGGASTTPDTGVTVTYGPILPSIPPLFNIPQNSSAPLTTFPQSAATSPAPLPPPSTIIQVANTQNSPEVIQPPPPPPPPANTAPSNDSSSTPPETDNTSTAPPPAPPPPPPPTTATNTAATTSPDNPDNETPTGGNNSGDIFSTGAVTFRFDDGWQSQLDVALPALQAAGFKGTFYIVTRQLREHGFSGFISSDGVKQIAAAGHEVGDHTQTHPHLPTLSADQQRAEIIGAKEDLEALGITAQTFSFPYGEYTSNTLQIVKNAGFSSAVTTIETPVSKTSDRFQLQGPSLQVTDTPEKVEQMIQNAVQNHQWLIMTFHRIDTSGDQYSMSPANFRAIVDYVKDHHIPVVTVSGGAAQLSH